MLATMFLIPSSDFFSLMLLWLIGVATVVSLFLLNRSRIKHDEPHV
jgi:hypothetical protein